MAFYTQATARAMLADELPNGSGISATILNRALRNATAYAGTWVRDVQRVDFVGDGITTRFALTGTGCELLDAQRQETPTGLADAVTLTAPGTAPSVAVVGAGGSISKGVYYVAVAYTAVINGTTCVTGISPTTTVTVASGTTNEFSCTWTPPSTATDPTCGSQLYCSPGSGSPDISASITASGATGSGTITALPSAGTRPRANYTQLWTYQPQMALEQDVTPTGATTVDTATLTLGTAPKFLDRFRVVYECAPALPSGDSDVIRVPQQDFELLALMFAHRALAYLRESGDTTQHLDAYQKLDLLVQDLQKKASPRPRSRPRMPDPTT